METGTRIRPGVHQGQRSASTSDMMASSCSLALTSWRRSHLTQMYGTVDAGRFARTKLLLFVEWAMQTQKINSLFKDWPTSSRLSGVLGKGQTEPACQGCPRILPVVAARPWAAEIGEARGVEGYLQHALRNGKINLPFAARTSYRSRF